jgi:hypothetical protein
MWEKHELGIVPYIYALLTLEWHFRNVVWRATASYIRSKFSVLRRELLRRTLRNLELAEN